MSAVFEGVLLSGSFEDAEFIISSLSSSLNLEIGQLAEHLLVISRVESTRSKLLFTQQMEYVASQISLLVSSALLVRYDDRIGHRSSILFQEGMPIKSFSEIDEIWVLTDEERNPIVDGKKFSI
jgi:hypothetical protein